MDLLWVSLWVSLRTKLGYGNMNLLLNSRCRYHFLNKPLDLNKFKMDASPTRRTAVLDQVYIFVAYPFRAHESREDHQAVSGMDCVSMRNE